MAKKLWDSRFKKALNPLAESFLRSITFDKELAKYDIDGSIAHAKMLGKCKIIAKRDSDKLVRGLKSIKVKNVNSEEDIHSAITNLLFKKLGNVSEKLHTARSRNDQVALDTRMYVKDKAKDIISRIKELQKGFLKFATKNLKVVIPAYTHMQQAQCVLLAHHVLSFIEMFERDKGRIADAYKRADVLPLGSCALSGTGLKIDRNYVAKLLNFSKISTNSMDAVSDRDFVIEFLSAIAILVMHLSRISEDFILWSTKEYDFIDIDESFCTGSSIMPHKKNPDVLEYIRGYAGKSYGNLLSLLVTMKGLPSTYNRDMQHDKEPLFESVKITSQILVLLAKLVNGIKINKKSIEKIINKDIGLYSVDMVEDFVKNEKKSYKEAHKSVGKIMIDAYANSNKLNKKLFPGNSYSRITKNLIPVKSVNLKISSGGTATKLVNEQIKRWEKSLRLTA